MAVKTITPSELARVQKENGQVELIDVRTPVEFHELHVAGAKNVPLDRLDPQALLRDRNGTSDAPMYLICKLGGRGKQAAEKLAAADIDAVNVDGGTLACEQAGLPMVRGKKSV